jgi:ribosome biogenesis GTPase
LRGERISGRGELTRKRTIMVDDHSAAGAEPRDAVLGVDMAECLAGRVLSVQGLTSTVQTPDGQLHQCATRRLLKTLSTDQRHVVAAGDRVQFRPAQGNEGIIERIEPRHGVLSRNVRGRQHVIVANVDQLLIVASAAEPYLKPNLIDRFLVSAEKNRIRPLIVINKIDLVERGSLAPMVGVFSQMGYRVLLVSARTGFGMDRVRRALANCATAVAGQSGVGKSSLLNAVETDWSLRVAEVSEETQKGRHTTTTARLLTLGCGGYVIDTPGIRQFQLWDIVPEEVAGCYRDLRPFVNKCRFPNCTHTHEADCAVKDAVADGWLDARRYESYCHLFSGDMAV